MNMNSLLVMALLLFVWPWSSAKEYHMKASDSVPAATGTVKIQKGNGNGNTMMDIKVNHLANPQNLRPSENVYIVWISPPDAAAEKGGAIVVDKNLDGELKVVTVSKDFDVFITAEQSKSVTVPSSVKILEAHVSVR